MSSSHPTRLSEWIAGEVRAEMARQRKTGNALGALLNVSQQSASRRMNADTAFTFDELDKIADWLGVPVTQFLRKTDLAETGS